MVRAAVLVWGCVALFLGCAASPTAPDFYTARGVRVFSPDDRTVSEQIDAAWVEGVVKPSRVTVIIEPPHPVYGPACFEDDGKLWAGREHGGFVWIAYDLGALRHEFEHVQGRDVA